MGAPESEHIFGIQLRESADDGSDFTNADADYRKLFLGEDGDLHLKDSAGTVTDVGGAGGAPDDAEYITYAANGGLSAERVVVAPATGGNVPYVVRKAANQTVNNSSTLVNDDTLVFAMLANEVWHFEVFAFFSSGSTPDIKIGFDVPASATINWWAPSSFQAAAGVAWGNNVNSTDALARDFEGAGAGTFRGFYAIGIVANSTNAGNCQMQWAQNTANASDTIIYANSLLRAWKLA